MINVTGIRRSGIGFVLALLRRHDIECRYVPVDELPEDDDGKWLVVRRKPSDICASMLRAPDLKAISFDPTHWGDEIERQLPMLSDLECGGVWFREIWPHRALRMNDDAECRYIVDCFGKEWRGLGDIADGHEWNAAPEGQDYAFIQVRHNTPTDERLRNIKYAISLNLNVLAPASPNRGQVALIAGGPSIKDHIKDIRRLKKEKVAIVAMNGTYRWLLSKGIVPDFFVMMDGRDHETNRKFVERIHKDTVHLIASQCHSSVFDSILAKDGKLALWHSGDNDGVAAQAMTEMNVNHPSIMGYSTIGLRSMVLFLFLGVRHFHMIGYDTCYKDDAHHAYEQKANDGERTHPIIVGDRRFMCAPWMHRQAEDFKLFAQQYGDKVILEFYGDGLLTAMIQENHKRRTASAA